MKKAEGLRRSLLRSFHDIVRDLFIIYVERREEAGDANQLSLPPMPSEMAAQQEIRTSINRLEDHRCGTQSGAPEIFHEHVMRRNRCDMHGDVGRLQLEEHAVYQIITEEEGRRNFTLRFWSGDVVFGAPLLGVLGPQFQEDPIGSYDCYSFAAPFGESMGALILTTTSGPPYSSLQMDRLHSCALASPEFLFPSITRQLELLIMAPTRKEISM
eukprot:Selendium_serpulae@DN6293_c0_g2_i6.p1